MPTLQAEQLRAIAAALMRLRGDTLSSVGMATGIRPANLSVWLRGKEQVISAKRVATLMYHLGLEGSSLRADILHQWRDAGALDDLRLVLNALVGSEAVVLYQDGQPGLSKIRFLQVGDVLVRVELTAGVAAAQDLADVIQPHRVIVLAEPLAAIPVEPLSGTREALLTLAEQAANDVDDDELLDSLLFQLGNSSWPTASSNTSSPVGWQKLEQALRAALHDGFEPSAIAQWISAARDSQK